MRGPQNETYGDLRQPLQSIQLGPDSEALCIATSYAGNALAVGGRHGTVRVSFGFGWTLKSIRPRCRAVKLAIHHRATINIRSRNTLPSILDWTGLQT